ncbi:hypothetical protein LQ424_30925 [Rhodococcus qingshengii]|uniref:hypothetical protein n=1 Tax=Rhodococcus qingshengii TaxID=334542 RepID=UPI001E4A2932|nr:hypothetical protein [Rhodococcus qingshengii]MCD2136241.1 hypothetical protein [Rhodococcus qingshengii]
MAFFDTPPSQAIVQQVDQNKYAEEQLKRRRLEDEERKRALAAESRRKADERQKRD